MIARTRILLVDDHTVLREALRAFLERQPELEVVGEAANGRDAIALAQIRRPDVVVMDIAMPELNGLEATRRIHAAAPSARIVALSMHADERYVTGMFEAGACGYLLKECESAELLRAIDAVRRGRTYVTPEVAHVVTGRPAPQGFRHPAEGRGTPPADVLTPREREVLQLVAEGRTSKEIAQDLGAAIKTIETHRLHIMKKLDLHSIAALTRYAIREGIVDL